MLMCCLCALVYVVGAHAHVACSHVYCVKILVTWVSKNIVMFAFVIVNSLSGLFHYDLQTTSHIYSINIRRHSGEDHRSPGHLRVVIALAAKYVHQVDITITHMYTHTPHTTHNYINVQMKRGDITLH